MSSPDLPPSRDQRDRLDDLFTALAADDRRAVIQYFRSSGDSVASIDDLIASMRTRDGLPDDGEQIAITLHHRTLPKLADAGLIDYDERSQTFRYRGDPLVDRIFPHIAQMTAGL